MQAPGSGGGLPGSAYVLREPTSSLVPESTGMMKNIGNRRTNTGRKNVDIESTRYPVQSINISAISLDTYSFSLFFSLPLFFLFLFISVSLGTFAFKLVFARGRTLIPIRNPASIRDVLARALCGLS